MLLKWLAIYILCAATKCACSAGEHDVYLEAGRVAIVKNDAASRGAPIHVAEDAK